MNKKTMQKKILLTILIFFFVTASAQKLPNIIYIMADDLGYADLSCYGRMDYKTPHLDKLCSQGIKFTTAYAAAPLCTPTRTGFMTGRYPARTPVGLREPLDWNAKDTSVGLTPAYPSLPTLLKKAGYETFLVGKWHLGFSPEFSPLKNGFDEFFGFNGGGIDYTSHTDPKGNNDLFENDKLVIRDGYLTDLLTEKTIEFIKRKHSKPFFLSLQFNAPHWPWQAPGDKPYPTSDTAIGAREWAKGGSSEIFAAMVKSMDDAVGRIMQTLDELKLSANTVVIFTSDNGGEKFSDMGGFARKKSHLWEGGIREPAFVRWPGKIKAKSTTDQPIITMDFTATILALAKAKADPRFPLDGIDLIPVLTAKKKMIPRTFYWRATQRVKQKAIRDGNWKYLQDENGEYLFNVANDPGEQNDLKEQQKQVFEKLKKKLSDWEKTVLEPVPLR
jgi:arylsulfatase A-like enzyme